MGRVGKGARKRCWFQKGHNFIVSSKKNDFKGVQEIKKTFYTRVPRDIIDRISGFKPAVGYLRPGPGRSDEIFKEANEQISSNGALQNQLISIPHLLKLLNLISSEHGMVSNTCKPDFEVLDWEIRGLGTALKLHCRSCHYQTKDAIKLYGKNYNSLLSSLSYS